MNRDKHIWEGWTVGDFIDDIEPIFNMCAPLWTSKALNVGLHKNNLTTKNIYQKYTITSYINQDYEDN